VWVAVNVGVLVKGLLAVAVDEIVPPPLPLRPTVKARLLVAVYGAREPVQANV
jgi:hypothetical protein